LFINRCLVQASQIKTRSVYSVIEIFTW
jgi:hypothetical protein